MCGWNGCVPSQASYSFVASDATYHHTSSTLVYLCICNFTTLPGCDFNYTAPIIACQVLSTNYTPYPKISNGGVLQHTTLPRLLKQGREGGGTTNANTRPPRHHRTRKSSTRSKKGVKHGWWESLLGWSPQPRWEYSTSYFLPRL